MEKSHEHPGVSGKDQKKHSWINQEEFKEQIDFIREKGIVNEKMGAAFDATGDETNLFGRSDLQDQPLTEANDNLKNAVLEALSKSPQVDASRIKVQSQGSTIILEGEVDRIEVKRAAESLASNISGVSSVKNHLKTTLESDVPDEHLIKKH